MSSKTVRAAGLLVIAASLLACLAVVDVAGGWAFFKLRRQLMPETSEFWRVAPPSLAHEEKAEFVSEWESIVGAFEFQPYVLWKQKDHRGRWINVEQGIRRTVNAELPGSKPVTIVLFGGSSAWGFGARDERTIASEIARIAAREGLRWKVTNRADLGYVNWQETLVLAGMCADGEAPDVAIFLDGLNDVYAGLAMPRASRPLFDQALWSRAFERFQSGRSYLDTLDGFGRFWWRNSLLRRAAGRFMERGGEESPIAPQDAARADASGREIADRYLGQVNVAEALARQFGFKAVFFWQPTIHTKRSLSADEKRYLSEYPEESTIGPAYRSATRRIAESGRVDSIAATFDAEGPTVFFDSVHTLEDANASIARAMFPRIRAAVEAR